MGKTRILSCFLSKKSGGTTTFQVNMAKHINRDLFDIDFVCIKGNPADFTFFTDLGSKVFNISCFAEENKELFRNEFREILSRDYQVLHLHTNFWQSTACEDVAHELHIPNIIIHAHNTSAAPIKGLTAEQSLEKHNTVMQTINFNNVTHCIACSDLAASFLYGDRVPKEEITIIKYGIDTECFKYNPRVREQFRHELNLDGKFVIGHAGRFERQKNHVFIVDLFCDIHREIDNTVLLLAGEGSLEDDIRRRVEKLGLSDSVRFLGVRDDMYNLYNAMDVFILPSLYEGFGIVAIEAECNGLKTLLSDQIPAAAVITEITERLPLDLNIWYKKILDIYNRNYERKDCSALIRKAGFDMMDSIKTLEKIYTGEM